MTSNMSQEGASGSKFCIFFGGIQLAVDEEPPSEWMLLDDGTSNIKGSGTEIVLQGLGNIFIEQSLKFEFMASSN